MTGDIDPSVLWELAKSRHSDYLRAAEFDRNARRVFLHDLDLRHRLTLALADQLIALGLRLKQQYEPHRAAGQLYGRTGS